MTTWLQWAVSALRVALGGPDPTVRPLTPAHGWLLPPPRVKAAVAVVRR